MQPVICTISERTTFRPEMSISAYNLKCQTADYLYNMEFKALCELYDKVKSKKGFNEKTKVLQNFFNTLRKNEPSKKTEILFQVLRLLVPKLDRERSSYHLKEAKISKILIKMLNLPQGKDKTTLSKGYLLSENSEHFAEVAYTIIKKYITTKSSLLTLQELNEHLDKIANRSNESEAEDVLLQLFKKTTAEESKWIIKIILKDLKLGIDNNRILNSFHQDARAFFESNSNLRQLCEDLQDSSVRLNELEVKLFTPFKPMLSKRVDTGSFSKDFVKEQTYIVENKFDGERFQLHLSNGNFKYFSRNGFDYTQQFGKTFNDGIFSDKLTEVISPITTSVILDGEMMLYHSKQKQFGSKGMNFDVKKLSSNYNYKPCFVVFDILMHNNIVVTNKPLHERQQLLKEIISPKEGVLILSETFEVASLQEIVNAVNCSVDREEEGIVVKHPNSVYKFGERKGGWFKIKMDYFCDVMNDLDLILLGGNFTSINSKHLNSFIVGIRSGVNEEGKPKYLSFGKVATGLSSEENETLNELFLKKGVKYDSSTFQTKSKNRISFGKEVPHYWIEPEKSLIFLIRATELTRSDDAFRTSYTFRFPRVLKVRKDKPVEDCLDINELLELTKQNKHVIKLNKRYIELEELISKPKAKRSKQIIVTLQDLKGIGKNLDLLEGLKIFVLNGNDVIAKDQIEDIVRQANGTVVYKLDDAVDIVLLGKYDEEAKEFIRTNNVARFDIIGIKWLERIIQEEELLPYQSGEVFRFGCNFKDKLSFNLDRFGDSLTEPVDFNQLEKIFSYQLDRKVFFNQNESINSHFGGLTAYFDQYENLFDSQSPIIYNCFLDEIEFKYKGGKVSSTIDENTNYVICNNENRTDRIANYLTEKNLNETKIILNSDLYK